MKAIFLSAFAIIFAVIALTLAPVLWDMYQYEQQERKLRLQLEDEHKLRQQSQT